MRSFTLILPFIITLSLAAQTNLPLPGANAELPSALELVTTRTNTFAATNSATERRITEISSDSFNFDWKSRVAVYVGNVRVVDPQMRLTCALMTATVPESGKIDHIVAEQNVVIDALDDQQKAIHATGDRAVYSYRVVNFQTNETIELSGNPRVERDGGSMTGRTITWDRVNSRFGGADVHMVVQQKDIEPATAPSVRTPEPK